MNNLELVENINSPKEIKISLIEKSDEESKQENESPKKGKK